MDNQTATKYIFASLGRFYMLADGTIAVVDEGAIPLGYNTAKGIKEIIDMYLSQGEARCNELREKGIEEYWKPKPRVAKEKRKSRSGYVYLLKSEVGHYKIGRATDPENRQKTFGVQLPFQVEYVCLIKTDDMEAEEKRLHSLFSSKRINGEWFDLTPQDVEYIKSFGGVK